MGRPSRFTKKIADSICRELAKGRSLRAVCKPANMPAASTVCGWVIDHDKFAEQYTRARGIGYDQFADETLEIAAGPGIQGKTPGEKLIFAEVDKERVQRDRLQVDARKWYLSKLAPKKYGDRLEIDGKQTITLQMTSEAAKKAAELDGG